MSESINTANNTVLEASAPQKQDCDWALEVIELTKEFPGIKANDNVSIQFRQNEIHALLGENGAGKSTLMSIIFGLYQPDAGEIKIWGQKSNIQTPHDANTYRIGMVHQHFKLVDTFTVTENIILGVEETQGLFNAFLKRREAAEKIKKLCKAYRLDLEPEQLVGELTVGQQQKVEILKMLFRDNDILIFDEPTAVLMPQEIEELMNIIKTLKAEGKTIILITHKLKEIRQVADRCTVMRLGKVIGTVSLEDASNNDLTEMMVGKPVTLEFPRKEFPESEVIFSCQNLQVLSNSKSLAVKDVSFELKRGEILGLAGVDGNGQMELVQALAGLRPVAGGSISIEGKDITNASIRERIDLGIAYIPADRQRFGLVLDESLAVNTILKEFDQEPYSKNSWLKPAAFHETASKLIEDFDIRCSLGSKTTVRQMSGGNQQKIILAREISSRPKVILVEQPTRGLDLGAISYIYRRIIEERDLNCAILLVSFELDEIMNLADRIAVISHGHLMKTMGAHEVDEISIGHLMAGETI